jgi:hypothetical protein
LPQGVSRLSGRQTEAEFAGREPLDEIADKLGEHPAIRYIGAATGNADLIIEILARSNHDLAEFLFDYLAQHRRPHRHAVVAHRAHLQAELELGYQRTRRTTPRRQTHPRRR